MSEFSPLYNPAIGYNAVPLVANVGRISNCIPIAGGQIPVALIGDSITEQNNRKFSATAATWGESVATITASGHSLRVGCPIRYTATSILDGYWTVASVVSTSVFTFAIPNAYGSGSSSTSDTVRDSSRLNDIGYLTWANMIGGQKFNQIFNGGKTGDTSAGVLSRVQSEICSLDISACFLLIGTNDAIAGTAASTIFSNISATCDLLLAAQITPILMAVPPVNSGAPSASTALPIIHQLNNLLSAYALSSNRVVFIDTFQPLVSYSTGYALTTTIETNGVHPTRAGARVMGQAIIDAFGRNRVSALLTRSAVDNFTSSATNYNILDNAPWVATGGTVGLGGSGTAAQGFNCLRTAGSGTFVASAPARTLQDDGDAVGFNQRLVITSGGATDVFDARIVLGTDTATHARMVADASYEMRGTLRLTNVEGSGLQVVSVNMHLIFTDAKTGFSYSSIFAALTFGDTSAYAQVYPIGNCLSADVVLTLRSLPAYIPTVPTSSNGFGLRCTFQFNAATTTGNQPLQVDLGRFSIVRVS